MGTARTIIEKTLKIDTWKHPTSSVSFQNFQRGFFISFLILETTNEELYVNILFLPTNYLDYDIILAGYRSTSLQIIFYVRINFKIHEHSSTDVLQGVLQNACHVSFLIKVAGWLYSTLTVSFMWVLRNYSYRFFMQYLTFLTKRFPIWRMYWKIIITIKFTLH